MNWIEKLEAKHPVLFWTVVALILAAFVIAWVSVGEG